MKAPTRTDEYSLPDTEWSIPESSPQIDIPSGIEIVPCSLAGWHSKASSLPASPQTAVIWSIMPHGAPTTEFSIPWHSRARSDGSILSPKQDTIACITATSIAADELTPRPCGRFEAIRMRAPSENVTFRSRISTRNAPATYDAQ